MDNTALSITATVNDFAVNKRAAVNKSPAANNSPAVNGCAVTNISHSVSTTKQRGFTLIELLVVLVIISMFSGMIVLSIGDNFSRELRSEAERFQRLVVAASDEAIFSSSQLGVVIDKSQYSLVRFDTVSQSWQPLTGQAFSVHSLPEAMQLTWKIEGFSQPGRDDSPQEINFFGSGNAADNKSDLDDQLNEDYDLDQASFGAEDSVNGRNIMPQILMLSSGEVTVFSVEFSAIESVANSYVVTVISDGFSSPSIKSTNDNSSN